MTLHLAAASIARWRSCASELQRERMVLGRVVSRMLWRSAALAFTRYIPISRHQKLKTLDTQDTRYQTLKTLDTRH